MIEDENFDSIDEALEVSSEIIKKEPIAKPTKTSPKHLKSGKEDVEKDYEYSRSQLYSLVEKGQEAVDGALDVAQQSDSARAYEVAGQLIKHVADTADKLIDLQKKMKEIDEVKEKNTTNVTNNSLFVGSTADLQKDAKTNEKGHQMRSFKSINEEGNWQRLNKYGATYTITFQFRGQTKFIQMFFPQRARPLKKNVQYELDKVYPEQ